MECSRTLLPVNGGSKAGAVGKMRYCGVRNAEGKGSDTLENLLSKVSLLKVTFERNLAHVS